VVTMCSLLTTSSWDRNWKRDPARATDRARRGQAAGVRSEEEGGYINEK
jgi:hypothetical protein